MPGDTITLAINEREVTAPKGATVLEAARGAGIYIPTLCFHKEIKPFGACRICAVEIKGMRGLPTSCTTPATQGMVVQTETEAVRKQRRNILELLLTEHPNACLTCWRVDICDPYDICLRNAGVEERCSLCIKNKRCELQEICFKEKFPALRFPYQYRDIPVHQNDPFYERDYNLCIVCGRCVNVCHQVVGADALTFTNREGRSLVGTAFGASLEESGCIFCGACVKICPVGALTETAGRWAGLPQREVLTTCPYCGVGCQLNLEVNSHRIIRVIPADAPANRGQACAKGRFGLDFVHSQERLTTPLIKRGGRFEEASWDEALSLVANRLASFKGDQFALIGSAKCTNEENYLFQKFARAVMGTNNIDQNARLCHASTMAGLLTAFGSAAMTNSTDELAGAACILAIGTNTTETHPVIGYLVRRTARDGEAKLIVANPRHIELCQVADVWLRQRPGSDVALLGGMARVIIEENLYDANFIRERCENFEAFRDSILRGFDLAQVERETGVPKDKIAEAARMYATRKPAAILLSVGVTQSSHGTDNILALANLAMLTGNLGKPSAGVNPLMGQNNIQGACDMGCLPNLLPGYQPLSDETARKKFETAWGTHIPSTPGLFMLEMIEAMHKGQVKALYLAGENPVITNPDVSHVKEALNKLDFFVAQDIFLTESAQMAHVVLPACTFAEKDGTFTNTERRVQLVRQALPPQGQSQPDWWITSQIAQRMGARSFSSGHASAIMDELAGTIPSYGGISHRRLEGGGLQWPCPTAEHPGTPILHVGRFTRGKGRLMPLTYRPPQDPPDKDYPFILTTGRDLYQYQSGTMIRKSQGINLLRNEEKVQLHPQDASALGIREGERVKVVSRRGQVEATAKVTESSLPGVVFMTFHFAEAVTNLVTSSATDPVSGIPELKFCAVKVEKLGETPARR